MTETGPGRLPDPILPEVSGLAARAILGLLDGSHFLGPADLAGLVSRQARALGAEGAVVYLTDYSQRTLVPVPGWDSDDRSAQDIAGSLAGRCFQTIEVLAAPGEDARVHVWLPVVDGTERLGVLELVLPGGSLSLASPTRLASPYQTLRARVAQPGDNEILSADVVPPQIQEWLRFAGTVAVLLVSRAPYGDSLEFVRRSRGMALASELQWKMLPPLTFGTQDVDITTVLEPALSVAGDAFDYAVNGDVVHLALFDAMGHGLEAGLTSSVALAAYRSARRAFRTIDVCAAEIDAAIKSRGREDFATAILAELDVTTGVVTWLCAGHPLPLFVRAGQVHPGDPDQPVVMPLGVVAEADPETFAGAVRRDQLQPGDLMLVYSDGVVEARRPDGSFFSVERLGDFVVRHLLSGLPAPEVLRRVAHSLLEHQDNELQDDASVVLVEWRRTA